jgi:hypothetical protein
MSNYEYEKQQAEDRRHRRELEESAKATAAAAQHAARQAEIARIQQNASLKKQEQIAETNSFRNTVLGGLPLLDSEEKTKYIFKQISTRVSNIENEQIDIPLESLYTYTGIKSIINKSAQEVFESIEYKNWQAIAVKYNNHLEIWNNEKQKYSKKFGEKDDEWVLKRINTLSKFQIPAVIASVIFSIMIFVKEKDISAAIIFFLITAPGAWFGIRALTKPFLDSHFFVSNNKETFTQGIGKLKFDFESKFNSKFKDLNVTENSAKDALQKYFDEVLWGQIEKEQNFIPPNIAPKYEDWIKLLINNRSVALTFSKIKNSSAEISKNLSVEIGAPGISV